MPDVMDSISLTALIALGQSGSLSSDKLVGRKVFGDSLEAQLRMLSLHCFVAVTETEGVKSYALTETGRALYERVLDYADGEATLLRRSPPSPFNDANTKDID